MTIALKEVTDPAFNEGYVTLSRKMCTFDRCKTRISFKTRKKKRKKEQTFNDNTCKFPETFEVIYMDVKITQMYVQGHRGHTNPAVSTVPPTGPQNTGGDRNIKLRAIIPGGNIIHLTLWL